MRPPILVITVAFGVGLWAGGSELGGWGSGLAVLAVAVWLARQAPLGAAVGVVGVAGLLWGAAARRQHEATCEGRWKGNGTRAAIVRLGDPAPDSGGPVEADVVEGRCGGALRLRWPDGIPARGGTTWGVAGWWVGSDGHGVLVVRRAKLLDAEPRGRGAVRGRLAAQSAALFGRRAPIVDALVFAPNAALDPDVRERYARSGLAHILSISGLHVGFLAAWLGLILRKLGPSPRHRAVASGGVLLGYLWLLGFPAPALRATAMLVVDDVARLRQRVAAPRGVIALSALAVLLIDPLALYSIGAWLSVSAIAAVIWAGRATARGHWAVRALAPAAAATLLTAPITAFAFGTVAPIGVTVPNANAVIGAVRRVAAAAGASARTAQWPRAVARPAQITAAIALTDSQAPIEYSARGSTSSTASAESAITPRGAATRWRSRATSSTTSIAVARSAGAGNPSSQR